MKKQIVLFLMALLPVVAWAFTGEIEIDGIKYEVVTEGQAATVIAKGSKYTGDVVIPANIVVEDVECAVTSIGYGAFEGCTDLTSITIPSSVTSIGYHAFSRCTSLTSIDIPSSVTSIGNDAFSRCTGLTFIIIPSSVTSIGDDAFSRCTSLDFVAIPSSVTSIGKYAFRDCTSLTSIIIPSSVTSIESGAFSYCTGLTFIFIPSSVTSIGDYAFSYCTGLTSIDIPSSVTSIGNQAFSGCFALTSITIPSSVTSIGDHAFAHCPKLEDVFCYAESVPDTYDDAFEGPYIQYPTLHVPASAIESYRTTAPWSGFGTIVALDGEEPVVPEPEQCATPTIYYNSGKLSFKSDTEGATFVSEIKDADVKKFYDSEIALGVTYNISVYATKDGYKDSEVATATLCWIEVEPQKEGITDDEVSVSEVKAVPVLIQADGRQIVITGAADDTPISVFSINGMQAGSAISQNGKTTIPVQLPGNIAIVKIGDRSVKVMVK